MYKDKVNKDICIHKLFEKNRITAYERKKDIDRTVKQTDITKIIAVALLTHNIKLILSRF